MNMANRSQANNTGVSKSFHIKVARDAASDDATGDAELWGLEIRET